MNILVIETSADAIETRRRLQQILSSSRDATILLVGDNAPVPLPDRFKPATAADVVAMLRRADDRAPIAYLPASATYSPPEWRRVTLLPRSVMAWPVEKKLPEHSCSEPDSTIDGWVMSAGLARDVLAQRPVSEWRLDKLGPFLEAMALGVHWMSSHNAAPALHPPASSEQPMLTSSSRVLAVIPHFACEAWLATALASLTKQTRPLDGIVVIDDASPEPPADICRMFPEVTLLRSTENVGPYRLTQQAIDDTDCDAILFQDADDWSCADRVELALAELQRTGAEWIGTQEIRLAESGAYQPASYPLDVNRASADGPQHPLLNPTSLVSRDLVQRLGGFATGLRFSNDTELLYRAVFVARIVNLPTFSFIHRKRQNSMVTSPEIGMHTRKRQDLLKLLHERADRNVVWQREGKPLDLTPLSKAPGVALAHVCGPRLHPARR
jgi:GT2 family glycosyltransferase